MPDLEPAHWRGRLAGPAPVATAGAAGIACSISTDDPAMFGTDLAAGYAVARQLGLNARDCYLAGERGALCDQRTMDELRDIGESFDWASLMLTSSDFS